jgi:hypothetical protein
MAGFPAMQTTTFWQTFVSSRRGYGTSPNVLLPDTIDSPPLPTEFARPFRSFGGWAMTPATITGLQPTREIDCTLLRSDTPGGSNRALFQFDSTVAAPGPYNGAWNNPDPNPFFRYQGLARLGNLVATRSNVYAVWITVGYFEATPASQLPGFSSLTQAQIQAMYPDGYTVGRELGMDTGDIQRHRAFYIFDRTIPVGFQRGQDLNVEKAILVKRFIE